MIRGQTREKETVHPVNATVNAGIHNRFDIEVLDAETGAVKQKAVGYNVICDNLWTRLFGDSSYFNYIQYGGGSGTPSASDTSLFTYIGYDAPASANDVENLDRANGVYSFRRKIQLAPETAVGQTITEVGIAYGTATSGNLVTHAMLQDMNGNQISITKTATDVINIYATIYIHLASSGFDNGHVGIANTWFLHGLAGYRASGSSSALYSYPRYAAFLSCGGFGGLNHQNSSWDGSDYPNTRATISASYDATNKRIVLTASRLAVGVNNIGGIRSVHFISLFSSYYWPKYCSFEITVGGNNLPGTTITGEAIGTGDGTTTDFATDFPMVSNAKVYVDGAEDTTVTVDENQTTGGTTYYFGSELNCIEEDGTPRWGGLPVNRYYFIQAGCYENPLYQTCGIASVSASNASSVHVYCTNNLSSWNDLGTFGSGGSVSVPAAYQNCRYWKVSGSAQYLAFYSTASANNIHFATAPAAGAVITADYYTKTIAKDENHVFDLTVTIQLGEYSEE